MSKGQGSARDTDRSERTEIAIVGQQQQQGQQVGGGELWSCLKPHFEIVSVHEHPLLVICDAHTTSDRPFGADAGELRVAVAAIGLDPLVRKRLHQTFDVVIEKEPGWQGSIVPQLQQLIGAWLFDAHLAQLTTLAPTAGLLLLSQKYDASLLALVTSERVHVATSERVEGVVGAAATHLQRWLHERLMVTLAPGEIDGSTEGGYWIPSTSGRGGIILLNDEPVVRADLRELALEASVLVAQRAPNRQRFSLPPPMMPSSIPPGSPRTPRADSPEADVHAYVDFFRNSTEGIMVVTLNGTIRFCNRRAASIFGHSQTRLCRSKLLDLISHSDRPLLADMTDGFRKRKYPLGLDLPVLTKDGERRILSLNASPAADSDAGIILSFRDVTASRQIETELVSTRETLQAVIDSSADAIISADLKGRVVVFNPAASRICGYVDARSRKLLNVKDLYPKGVARNIMKALRDPGQGGVITGYETELLDESGAQIPVLISASLMVASDKVVGSVGVFKDLREVRDLRATLKATRQKLAVQDERAFVTELAGAAAHELNQPLTAIGGYSQMLDRQNDLTPQQRRLVDRIVSESDRMAEIVRKIGKLTKFETKAYVGDTTIIDIDKSVELSQVDKPTAPK